jgi:hypothetical protein
MESDKLRRLVEQDHKSVEVLMEWAVQRIDVDKRDRTHIGTLLEATLQLQRCVKTLADQLGRVVDQVHRVATLSAVQEPE